MCVRESEIGIIMPPHTPPPPGFVVQPTAIPTEAEAAAPSQTKTSSSSFHNLALALGTGLAESMDDCLANDPDHPSSTTTTHQYPSSTDDDGTTPTIIMNNTDGNDDNNTTKTHILGGLPRIHTPDTYARQSRHSVSRLVGCGCPTTTMPMPTSALASVGGNGFGSSSVGGVLLGLEYRTSNATTTTPAMMWHTHQPPQQHQKGLADAEGKDSHHNIISNNIDCENAHGNNDNHGKPLLFFSHPEDDRRNSNKNDIFHNTGSSANGNTMIYHTNTSNGNNKGGCLTQDGSKSTCAATTARYTAAVMAKNLENGSSSGIGAGEGRGKLLFGNIHEWATTSNNPAPAARSGTASFPSHESNGNGIRLGSNINKSNHIYNINNNSIVGLTVVEPSSNRNSPALPHPPSRSSVVGNSAALNVDSSTRGVSGSGGGRGGIGDGLFYQSWQQQLQQRFMLSPSVVVVGGVAGGGRASAPPPQSARLLPSILTIGAGGGLVVGGRVGSGTSTPDFVPLNKQANNNDSSRSSTPSVGTIGSVTPIPDPAINKIGPDGHALLQGSHGATVVVSDQSQQEMELAAVRELAPFLRDTATGGSSFGNDGTGGSSVSTRGLAILHASSIRCHDVRSTCEAFGALETFRSDFGESRGVFFATYYDLRNAQLAVMELPKILNKLRNHGVVSPSSFHSSGGIVVKYCVPLNSSNATDESMLLLSNLPGTVDEYELSQTLSSFGEVRTIHYQATKSHHEDEEGDESSSYLVEFYDIQDAKQALLELEHVHDWGDAAKIEVGTRSPTKRKLGKELILLLSCWRQGKGGGSLQNRRQSQGDSVGSTSSITHTTPSPPQLDGSYACDAARSNDDSHLQSHIRTDEIYHQNIVQQTLPPVGEPSQYRPQPYYQYPNFQNAAGINQQYQLVVGPDGQYSYVLINQCPQILGPHYGHAEQPMMFDQHSISQHHQQQVMYAPTAELHYNMHNPHHHLSQLAPPQQYHAQYNVPALMLQQPCLDFGMHDMVPLDTTAANGHFPPTQVIRMPSNDTSSLSNNGGHHVEGTCGFSAGSSSSGSPSEVNSGVGATTSNNREDEVDNSSDLSLLIENVLTGKDCRSSLMVRNIPNKYTQQMLLSEFAAAGHGPNKMDFFYLPIDFKNKCNRGYAFVNFVNYKDIIPFVEEYSYRGWKRFNSDKICDITYARIQGKAAMWKRFENSALMGKEDAFRPKIFVSHGEKKGQVENIMPTVTRSGGNGV